MVRYMRSRRTSFPDELAPDKFSIQGDDKQKNNTSDKKCPTNIPIQELENLFRIKKERKDTKFMNHLQQNIQFAKENNLLKIKINELESRLNNLLKENLKLKQENSINESKYKKTLNEQINILEYGIFKRFDEIILMFDNIRQKESLSTNLNPLWSKYHPDNSNDNSNLNNNNNNNNNMYNLSNTLLTPSKKRNRRKSMFIQSDDLPSMNIDNQNNHISQSSDNVMVESSIPILKHPDNSIDEDISNNNNNNNNSTRSSPSILDYSIPEEPEDKLSNTKQSNIYNNNNIHIQKVDIPIPVVQSNNISGHNMVSSESHTEKNQRKRTQKYPPKTQKTTKKSLSKDDIMPSTISNTNKDGIEKAKGNPLLKEPIVEGRSLRRSTRGKIVNYKLPSLRAKMRRPTEKLVDATIVNDIHEYEVNLNKNTIIKEEPTTPSLKHIDDKVVLNSKYDNTKEGLKGEDIDFLKTKDTKPKENIRHTDQSMIDNSANSRLITSNSKDTVLRKKTEIYNDLSQDFIVPFSEGSDTITQDVKSDKVTPKKLSRKRGINSILDDMEDKENHTSKGINFNTGECLKMKHTFDLKFNENLVSSSSSSPPSSLSKPLTSSKLNSSNNNNNNSSSILSDITNKNKHGKQLTKKNKKKLLKTAIINDLYNDAEDLDIYDKWNKSTSSSSLSSASSSVSFRSLSSSFHYQDATNNSKENRTVSFRFSDDDLSVFNLLDKSTSNIKKVKAKHHQ